MAHENNSHNADLSVSLWNFTWFDVLLQVGCRRASTEEGVSIHLARSGVIAHLDTPGTGVRRTLMSARQTLVRTRAPVSMTADDLPASA